MLCVLIPVFHLLQPRHRSTSVDDAVGNKEQESAGNDSAVNLRIGKTATKKVHVHAAIKLNGLPVREDMHRLGTHGMP